MITNIILSLFGLLALGQEQDEARIVPGPLAVYVGERADHYWKAIPSFYVTQGESKCFYEFVPQDTYVSAAFTGRSDNDSFTCQARITDSHYRLVDSQPLNAANKYGIVYYKSSAPEHFRICVLCDKTNWMAHGSTEISMKIEILHDLENSVSSLIFGNDGGNTADNLKSSNMDIIRKSMRSAYKDLEVAIEFEMAESSANDAGHESIEKTKHMIMLMVGISLLFTGISMWAVVSYLRSFFQREKVI